MISRAGGATLLMPGLDVQEGGGGAAAVVDTGPYDLARQEEYASNSGTSLAVTLRQAPVIGNLLVCNFGCRRPVANMVGPGAGWTAAVTKQASTSCSAGIWYKISDGSETVITCTQTAAAAAMAVLVREFPGVSASPLDVTVSNSTASGTSLNFGTTGTTAQANELACALLFTSDSTPRRLAGWSGGFDQIMSPVLESPRMHVADKLLAATGTVTTTPAWETSNAAVGCIATFKLSAPPTRPAMPVRRLVSGAYTTVENAGTTRALRSFATSANRLVVCAFAVSDDGGISADTTIAPSHGGALTWTIIKHDLGGAVSRHVYIAYAWSATDNAADSPVLTFGQTGSALWYSVVEIGTVDLSTPVPQYKRASIGGAGATAIDITQDVAPSAGSTMIGIVLHGAGERHVHEAGYHIIEEGECGDKSQQVSAFWYPVGDQTARVSWASTIHVIAIAAEIKRAA